MTTNKKLWGGRFDGVSSSITEQLSCSVHYDNRLYAHDIKGSKAHAAMLHQTGIISADELSAINGGLDAIMNEIETGKFQFKSELEDVHMNIESRLTELIGDAGKKLHTARSRNDQVALDTRMFVRDVCLEIDELLLQLINRLAVLAEAHVGTVMPGYTHMQIAQPVRLAQHLLAWTWPLVRDRERLAMVYRAVQIMPLGAGALAGVNYPTSREHVREQLEFERITPNSMDTVADRDYALDFLYFSATLGMHLSRMCEELVLWSTAEYRFIRLADYVTTGSSIMPQKRNPDLAELIRGKSGRLYGNLVSLLVTLKGLPLTYNRDMQEDKEPLFDSIDTVRLSLLGMIEMLKDITFNTDRMAEMIRHNYSTATDLADYLVQKGVPFRSAHEIVGNLVRYCEETGTDFFTMPIEIMKARCALIDNDVYQALDPLSSTERKLSAGSTATTEIKKQLILLKEMIVGSIA